VKLNVQARIFASKIEKDRRMGFIYGIQLELMRTWKARAAQAPNARRFVVSNTLKYHTVSHRANLILGIKHAMHCTNSGTSNKHESLLFCLYFIMVSYRIIRTCSITSSQLTARPLYHPYRHTYTPSQSIRQPHPSAVPRSSPSYL
jgi:hypothetical protein